MEGFNKEKWKEATGRDIPAEPSDLEDWERAGLDDLAHSATKCTTDTGRWNRENRYAVVYSALCSIYRINKKRRDDSVSPVEGG